MMMTTMSVTSRCSVETAERIDRCLLAWELLSTYRMLCVKGNSGVTFTSRTSFKRSLICMDLSAYLIEQ